MRACTQKTRVQYSYRRTDDLLRRERWTLDKSASVPAVYSLASAVARRAPAATQDGELIKSAACLSVPIKLCHKTESKIG